MRDLQIIQYVRIKDQKLELNGKVDYSLSKSANLSEFLERTYRNRDIKYRKFFKMDNLSKLGFLASEVLLKDKKLVSIEPDETAIVLCNSSSSLETDQNFQKSISDFPSPSTFVYTLPNVVIGEICIRNGFKGEIAFFVQKEFDSQAIATYVKLLFETTKIRQCLTGWVEVTIDNQYFAVFYLVAREKGELKFTRYNLEQIFQKTI